MSGMIAKGTMMSEDILLMNLALSAGQLPS